MRHSLRWRSMSGSMRKALKSSYMQRCGFFSSFGESIVQVHDFMTLDRWELFEGKAADGSTEPIPTTKCQGCCSSEQWKQASEHSQGIFISGFVLDPDCMTSWLTRPPHLGDKTDIPLSSYSPAPWHLHWGLTTITRFKGIVGSKNREKWNDTRMTRVGGT